LREEFARLAVDLDVEQDRGLHAIPIVSVVGRSLEPPDQFSVVGVERHDGAGPQIAAGAALPGAHRVRVASAPINQIELRVVGSGKPGHAAAMPHGFGVWPGFGPGGTGLRRGIPSPLHGAGLGVARFQESGHIQRVATDADNHMITDDQRSGRGEVLLLDVGDGAAPADFAGARVERNQVVVRGLEEEPIPIDPSPRLPMWMPPAVSHL
jgi:hypothetical protein